MKKAIIYYYCLFTFLFTFTSLSQSTGQKPELVLPKGHTFPVTYVSFSPDLKLLVSSSRDSTAKIWNVQEEKLLFSLEGHKGWVNFAEFSPDGMKVITASDDSTAKVWDVNSGKLIFTLKGNVTGVACAYFSPDNKFIITTAMDDITGIWDSQTFKLLHVLKGRSGYYPTNNINAGAGRIFSSISHDGKRLVTASIDGRARIWDVETGRLLIKTKGHYDQVYSVTFSEDDKNIITTSNDESSGIWNSRTGKLIRFFEGGTYPASLNPDMSKIVTVGSNHTPTVYDGQTGDFLFNLYVDNDVCCVLFSPDGKYILTSSDYAGIVRLWDAETGKLVHSLQENVEGKGYGAELVRFSPDGKWILSMPLNGSIEIWDKQSGRMIHCLK